ncbi:MAG: rRNA maturation RNase YbeY [Hyphomicrobiales bacterium]
MILSIEVEHDGWSALPELETLARQAVAQTLSLAAREAAAERTTGEILVLLTSDAEVRALNKAWRGKDKATNVLSFPFPPDAPLPPDESRPLGDIALAFETVQREAEVQGKVLEHHALHLIVHGTLHLLGYDHEDDAEAETMENAERQILAALGMEDPYRT